MKLHCKLLNRETDEATFKNFDSKEAAEKFFFDSYFLFAAEFYERANLLPIGGKLERSKYVDWYDE